MENTNWVKVYVSFMNHEIEIIKGLLEANEIISVAINKIDSSYTTFGEVELFVKESDILKAIHIIKERKN